ncbi:MAG TPA: hypothetical protein DCP20_02165 [Coriobacteriia bacterium]|jgi:glycopeptide antibiotics resistance protein|nr:hypothetical protein [Coriobacteriia bacterium]
MYQGSSLYVFAIPAIGYVIWRSARRRSPLMDVLLWVAFIIYVTELISHAFFPLPVDSAYIALERANAYGGHNLMPFRTISAMLEHPVPGVAAIQIVGNLLLFLPLGYFLPLLFQRFMDFRRAMETLLAFVLAVEVAQYLLSSLVYRYTYKSFDVDDILLNTAGALIGYGLGRLFAPGIHVTLPIPQDGRVESR